MSIDRSWAIIISALLASVLVGNILWENRRPHSFEALVTFDGYVERNERGVPQINAVWPPKRYALVTVKQVLHSDFGSRSGALSIGLPDRTLKTNQGHFLVKGQTYSFHLSRRIVSPSGKYGVKVFETPPAK